MRIGELAERSGVTLRTIRYYIEQRLLPPPPTRGKYGDFDESYVQRLRLIRHLKRQRLSLQAIRGRLEEMGLASPEPGPRHVHASEGEPTALQLLGETTREGLFRSRFAEEAGLTSEQVSRLEALGLLESSEGLLPQQALPLAQAAARLLASGATLQDIAEITQQIRQEVQLHRRLLQQSQDTEPLVRALRLQEQLAAIATIRQIMLQRWGYSTERGV